MNHKSSIHYKTAAEFQDAMQVAFETAKTEAPDDPALKFINDRIQAATRAMKAYRAGVEKTTVHTGSADCEKEVARLEKTALQCREGAQIALKKWYSAQWLGRQTRRGIS